MNQYPFTEYMKLADTLRDDPCCCSSDDGNLLGGDPTALSTLPGMPRSGVQPIPSTTTAIHSPLAAANFFSDTGHV